VKQLWTDRKLEQAAERLQHETKILATIPVNGATARVMQAVEKNACDHLEKLDSSPFQVIYFSFTQGCVIVMNSMPIV
jgi:hypothetical protein